MESSGAVDLGTETYRQRLSVPFDYPVIFTRDCMNPENPSLAGVLGTSANGPHRCIAYIDEGLLAAHPDLAEQIVRYAKTHSEHINLVTDPQVVPGGETAKDGWPVVQKVIDDLGRHGICRHSFVLALGGGAALDAVGLGASLVHRGVRLVRFPSTSLSQGDAGVGVKNGVNVGGVKNFAGTFAPPFAIIDDFSFLATLSVGLKLDGMAEAFKVAIIKDEKFFDDLCKAAARLKAGDLPALEDAVRRSAILHLDHIRDNNDPFEFGEARPLDFGHWSAHRLEGMSNYAIRHGEAVAIGVALDSVYAQRVGRITSAELDRILDAFDRAGLPIWHPLLADRDDDGRLRVLDGLRQFREHLGGVLTITLPDGIGRRVEVNEMDTALIEQCGVFLRDRAAG